MKRILYFDCFSGISGDMTLGALMDLGLDCEKVAEELSRLHVPGYRLTAEKAERHAICGTDVTVHLDAEHFHEEDSHQHPHTHEHEHEDSHQHHHQDARNLHHITHIIQDSSLSSQVKKLSLAIFTEIALAEAAVHGKPLEEVHFHEVGALDSIVDIVGTAICLSMLHVDEIHCSVVAEGHGFVKCQHGMLPVPVPAVAKMMEGSIITLQPGDKHGELVTPTGFGILKAAAKSCGSMPSMDIEKVGYGFGKRETGALNALRVFLGTERRHSADAQTSLKNWETDQVTVLECTLDDLSSEVIGYTLERLLENGALDAYTTPIYMKKNRPAVLLTVLCVCEKKDALAAVILEETTTIGIRHYVTDRYLLPRSRVTVNTEFGPLSVKVSGSEDEQKQKPEYEDCARLARKHNVPLRSIYSAADVQWAAKKKSNNL